jgi:hypothetical protein
LSSYIPKPVWPELQLEDPLARVQGLVAAYPMFEGSGNSVRDFGGRNNRASLTATSWVNSPFGSALSFNGSTSTLQSATTFPTIDAGDFTIALWFCPTSIPGAYIALFDNTSRDPSAFFNAGGVAATWYLSYGAKADTVGTITIAVNNWYRFVWTHKGSNNTVYINGVVSGTSSGGAAIIPGPSVVQIGLNPSSGGQKFTGYVADCRTYNRALSASEVALDYFDPFAIYRPRSRWGELVQLIPPHPGYISKPAYPQLNRGHPLANRLLHSWPFFEGAGVKVGDYSSKRFDGTTQASPSWVGSPYGSALSFDGSSQYVTTVPASEITTPAFNQPFSFGCVISIGATGLSGGSMIIDNQSGSGSDTGVSLFVASATSALEMGYWDGASYKSSRSSSQSLNTWLNVVAVSAGNGAPFKIYINGKADWSQNNLGAPTGTLGSVPWTIGGKANGLSTTLFNGSIAHVTIWNRALSAFEIALLNQDPFVEYRRRTRWWEVSLVAPPPPAAAPSGWFDPELVFRSWWDPELASMPAWFDREDVVAGGVTTWSTATTFAGVGSLTSPLLLQATDAVIFSGSGSLVESLILRAAIAAAFSGAGSLQANVIPEQFISALFAGQGSMSETLVAIEQIVALLAGAGLLSANAIPEQFISASFAGIGSLTTAALLRAAIATQFNGTGSMSEALLAIEQIVALFSGAGLLTSDVIPEQFISALFAGSGQLITKLTAQELIVALLSGASLLSVDVTVAASSTASALLTGTGSLTAGLLAIEQGNVIFAGSGLLSTQEAVLRRIAASFGGSGQLLADIIHLVPLGGSTFSGTGSLAVDTHVFEVVAALLSGTGSFNVSLLKLGPLEILFTGEGSLTEELRIVALSAALLNGQGTLFTDISLAPLSGARFAGIGTLYADLLHRVQKIGVWPRTGIIQADIRRGGLTNIVRRSGSDIPKRD